MPDKAGSLNPPWKPGQSGNPKGRPRKGATMTDVLEKVLKEKEVNFKGVKITGKEAAARKILELAVNGDVNALKYIFDRIDGKPDVFQHIESGDTPLIVINVPTDDED